MTDLKQLYAAIEGRTKGPWSFTDGNVCAIVGGDAHYISLSATPKNADFIATMGACADQIAAVLRAAEDAVNTGYWIDARYIVPALEATAREKLQVALAALAAACNTSGGTEP